FLVNRKHRISAKEFYDRYGGFTIAIARFIPMIRTFAPVVAGVGAMPYKRFIAYNVFGGIFWVMSTTLAGYFLGTLIPNIQDQIHLVIAIVIFFRSEERRVGKECKYWRCACVLNRKYNGDVV